MSPTCCEAFFLPFTATFFPTELICTQKNIQIKIISQKRDLF